MPCWPRSVFASFSVVALVGGVIIAFLPSNVISKLCYLGLQVIADIAGSARSNLRELSFTLNGATIYYGQFLANLIAVFIVIRVITFVINKPNDGFSEWLRNLTHRAPSRACPRCHMHHPGSRGPVSVLHLRGRASSVTASGLSRTALPRVAHRLESARASEVVSTGLIASVEKSPEAPVSCGQGRP
jgi:large-conductance mechanosensitive channel